MMDGIKTCATCAHYSPEEMGVWRPYYKPAECTINREPPTTRNLVTGQPPPFMQCKEARAKDGPCGQEGKQWSPKAEPEAPWWERFWS